MKKLLLNTCGEILTRENYEKVKDFNPKELQKLVGLYHRFIKECNGDDIEEFIRFRINKL